MLFDWQNLIAMGLVVAAVGYLGRRGWLALARRKAGCGACSNCPVESMQAADGKPLVTLGSISAPKTLARSPSERSVS
jgi:hypothetical protein